MEDRDWGERIREARLALELYRVRREQGKAEPVEDFLRRHEPLRGVLEGMLDDELQGGGVPPLEKRDVKGRILGDFRLVREIGRGGMAVVYEAEQLSLRRTVALKVLPAHLTLQDATIHRFHREALTAAKFRHRNIVEIHTVGADEGTHFFSMEFVRGAPLDKVIARLRDIPLERLDGRSFGDAVAALAHRPSSADAARASPDGPEARAPAPWAKSYVETVVRLVAEVADALDHAHRLGVIHRDAKPSNILVRVDATPILTDFGLAREEGLPSMTLTGEFAGTPYYVSPQQVVSRKVPIDHRTDVFSLGVTLFELLTLRRPFEGQSTPEILEKILTKEPPDPQKLNPRLAADLAIIVLKAIEKDPDRRYPTAAAFAADLRAFLEYRPIVARRASLRIRASRWARREPVKATLAAVLALLVPIAAGLGGYVAAKLPALRALAETARLYEVEQGLEEAFFELGEEQPRRAIAAFTEVLERDPAIAHLLSHHPERAVAFLDERRSLATWNPSLERIRAKAFREARRDDEAEEIERTLAKPATSLDFFLEGLRKLGRGEEEPPQAHAEALDLLTKAILASPSKRAFLHYSRAYAAGLAKDRVAAEQSAQTLKASWPDSPMAWLRIGTALHWVDPPAAIAAYKRASELDPTILSPRWNIALALRAMGNTEAAIEEYRRALEIHPGDARARLELGRTLEGTGDLDGAIAELRRSIELDPDFARAHYRLGLYLQKKGELEEACAALRRAIDLDPKQPSYHANLGAALCGLGSRGEAALAYRKALEIDPDYEHAHRNLVETLLDAGDFSAGRAEMEAWAHRRPQDVDAWCALALHFVDPKTPAEHRDLDRALEAARRAQRIADRRSPPTFLPFMRARAALVEVQKAQGDFEGARTELLRWTQVWPEDAECWNHLAWFFVDPHSHPRQRDAVAGLAAAKRAAALSKESDPAILDTLAQALYLNGDPQGAVTLEEKAISLIEQAHPEHTRMLPFLYSSLERFRKAAAKVHGASQEGN
jgi:serine/threonine protein kinase/Flp pilus assembly protein TadD